MGSRFNVRLRILHHAFRNSLRPGHRRRPDTPARILVAHHLLLGDTLMLTPLLAKLRENYPAAEIVMTAPKAYAPLYRGRPYGVVTAPYDPRDASTLAALTALSGFDLAIVPGDNRHSWLARALDARWVVAFAGDRPSYKNWPVDELLPYPEQPAAWGDMVAALVSGSPPATYRVENWPEPDHLQFGVPPKPYCVLHLGASSPLKQWDGARWGRLAEWLAQSGYTIVWSAGKGEEHLVAQADPTGRHVASYVARLDLAQMWHLLKRAALLVCPDTGIAHLGRIVNTPTVALFGPGSALLCGAGEFWRDSPYRTATIADFPCRDQNTLFKREIPWVRRCGRGLTDCNTPRCLTSLEIDPVKFLITELLPATRINL